MRQIAWVLLAAALIVTPRVLGQGSSVISGTVRDASGAVIPGADVAVVNTDTSFRYAATTNQAGIFRVPGLTAGNYEVTIEAPGFRRYIQEGVQLLASANFAVNAVLEIGSLAEQVEVTAQTPLLATETSSMGTSAKGEDLYDLPLYQRYVASTLNVTPGMTAQGYAYGGSLGAYRVAGQRGGTTGFYEDGVLANNQTDGTGINRTVQAGVEEVKVLTTTLPAEYGHSAGGVLDIVRKTGTNELHGHGSFFGRGRSMQHRLFFDRETNTQQDNTSFFFLPDASIGGPVRLPGYDGRNKTFFFFGYQKLIEKKTAQVISASPTPEMLMGDFSFGGVGRPIFDPFSTSQLPDGTWTRTPLPNNQVPQSRFDPVARNVLGIDPWVPPNQADTPNAAGPVTNLRVPELALTFFEDFSVRGDHSFSDSVKLFGSFGVNDDEGQGASRPINIDVIEFDGEDGVITPNRNYTTSIGTTWLVNPTTINEFRVGYVRRQFREQVPSLGQDFGSRLGIPNIDPALVPRFGTGSVSSAESIFGLTVEGPVRNIDETLSLRNDLTKIVGTHSLKMGYEILKFRLNSSKTDFPSGDFRFDQMTAGVQPNGQPVPATGNTFAGFLMGAVRTATFTRELATWNPRSSIHSFYIQDDWKFSPKLTLNLGLRWSVEGAFDVQSKGRLTNFSPNVIDDVTGLQGGFIHPTGGLSSVDKNNFQPRIGFAWNPRDRWVVRGGLGLFTVDTRFPQSRGQFEEFVGLSVFQRDPGDPRPVFPISNTPPQEFVVRPDGTGPFVGTNFEQRNATFWDPELDNAYAMNWSFSVQHEFKRDWLLETSYQGSSGVDLIEAWEMNAFEPDLGVNDSDLRAEVFARPQNFRPFPHFGSIRHLDNFGHSSFHAGTVQLQKRMGASGLMFSTFYTFSKSIDSCSGLTCNGVRPLSDRSLEKARSDFNRSHRVVANFLYELPFGRNASVNSKKRKILGGWEISGIATAESSNPLNLTFRNAPGNFFPTFAGARRPNVVVDDPRLVDEWRDLVSNSPNRFNQSEIAPVLDINDFANPDGFTIGNLGRNAIDGIPLYWTQFSAQKNIQLTERWRLQIRWDIQNAFHNFNFNPPTNAVDFQNPQTFAKLTSDPRTASVGGQPLQNITIALFF